MEPVAFQGGKENVETMGGFDHDFAALAGSPPFPWQRRLFREFSDPSGPRFRTHCSVPTGLGKTSILAIWLLALAHRASTGIVGDFPRRLAYVVNRRTVVDQATSEAERMRLALKQPELAHIAANLRPLSTDDSSPLSISTLRGAFADNGEWRCDPARPAIIVGTVDMIGSRILFSAYGRCGFKSKPLHAGLLGQDTLLVHDEAHLEPAFHTLLDSIVREQQRQGRSSTRTDARPLRVMALSATTRAGASEGGQAQDETLFGEEDKVHEIAGKRLRAPKFLAFHRVSDDKELSGRVASLALGFRDSGKAILVFLRRVKDVEEIARALRKEDLPVETLTGTQRGWERDALATSSGVFARFLQPKDRRIEPRRGTVFLVCTSAGEVGVNISADHLVCDLSPLDSMVQRFGRVNRFGEDEGRIEVASFDGALEGNPLNEETADENIAADAPPGGLDPEQATEPSGKGGKKDANPYALACTRTLSALRTLPEGRDRSERPGYLASPAALGQMLADLSSDARKGLFSPEPVIPPATSILFDAWTLTTIQGGLPGRPPIADWLHGLAEWEPPDTQVAWREEVAVVTGPMLETYPPGELLEDYPLKPHELLRDRSERVFEHLERIAARMPDLPVWVVGRSESVQVWNLTELVAQDIEVMEHATVVLPPAAGGLSVTGLLDADFASEEGDLQRLDVADQWVDSRGNPRRQRTWSGAKPVGMRPVRRIDLSSEAGAEDEDEPEVLSWCWYANPRSADDDGSRVARMAQELEAHLMSTAEFATRLVTRLSLEEGLARAVVMAARFHDLGKNRRVWQRSIGNLSSATVLAKSGPGMRPRELTRYRHELGSLLDVADDEEFCRLDAESRELVLHLIAAHHGRARPHFPADEAFDPEASMQEVEAVVAGVPQRFARLQRKYGRWGLAWMESLVRAADAMASIAILDSDAEAGLQDE